MYDPMTQAFEIKYPWWRRSSFDGGRYHDPFVTVWHVDPERDGTDDSCGWSWPKPSEKLIAALEREIEFERRDGRQFALGFAKASEGRPVWWLLWMNRASFLDRRRGLSARLIARHLYGASFPGDRFDSWNVDAEDSRRLAWIFARGYLQLVRPWWRHPRWHVWHWQVQIHPLLHLKRWLFTRCYRCGKGMAWGYAPVSDSWHGDGPRWFRGEKGVRHHDCANPASESVGQVAEAKA